VMPWVANRGVELKRVERPVNIHSFDKEGQGLSQGPAI
jgi:hypothetical protein